MRKPALAILLVLVICMLGMGFLGCTITQKGLDKAFRQYGAGIISWEEYIKVLSARADGRIFMLWGREKILAGTGLLFVAGISIIVTFREKDIKKICTKKEVI